VSVPGLAINLGKQPHPAERVRLVRTAIAFMDNSWD
jgi:hypothetical protein